MTTNMDLIERIDFEKIMPMSRNADGHDEQMQHLIKNSSVLAHWNEGDYEGSVATMIQLNDTKEIIIYDDYYGSCSGCDAWLGATDQDVIVMCKQLAAKAKIFSNVKAALKFLNEPADKYGELSSGVRNGLLKEYKKGLKILRG